MYLKFVKLFIVIFLFFLSIHLTADEKSNEVESEPSIYLPFPDFSEKEIKNTTTKEINPALPSLESMKLDDSKQILPDALPSQIKKSSETKEKTFIEPNKEQKLLDNGKPFEKKSNNIQNSKKQPFNKKSFPSNVNSNSKVALASNSNTKKEEKIEPMEEDLEFDPQEYKKNLERIRLIEKSDASKAIQEYKSLLTKYNSNKLQSEINLIIAWNYFHRNKFSESLEHVLAILDEPKNLDLTEYPTSLFLAGRIHEENWNGSNRNFAIKYYEKFLFHLKSNHKNFVDSYYIPKVKERFKVLQLSKEI